MKGSGLIVAAIILAGLVGALYWSNHHKPAETTEASADAAPKILAVKTPDISKFDLKKDGTEQVGAERKKNDNWDPNDKDRHGRSQQEACSRNT